MQSRGLVACMVGTFGALFGSLDVPEADAQNNSWISPNFGKWETNSNWSLGVAPASTHSVFITNFFSKTVTIDSLTAGSFAGTMTLSNLTVSSPPGTVNTLALVNSGTATPLRVLENSFIGNVIVSNGAFQSRELFIGNPGPVGAGTLTVASGLVALPGSFNGMVVGSNGGTGAVWQTGGQITTTNTDISIGGLFSPALGRMTISNGTTRAARVFVGGQGDGDGALTIAGGSLIASNLTASSATVPANVTLLGSGQLALTNLVVGNQGHGQLTVSNGNVVVATSILVGNGAGARGTMTFAGGSSTAQVVAVSAQFGATGTVWITGGDLFVSAVLRPGGLGDGQLTISNGTLFAGSTEVALNANTRGTLTIAGGTVSSPLTLNIANVLGGTGTVWLTGGQLSVLAGTTRVGIGGTGRMIISNGVFNAATITVGVNSGSAGTLTVAGGTLTAEQLVATNSGARIAFPAGTMTLRGARIYGSGLPAFTMGGTNHTAELNLMAGTNIFVTEVHVGSDPGSTGVVWQSGGLMDATGDGITLGTRGNGQMTVSNGTCRSLGTVVGFPGSSGGRLTVAGGDFHSYFGLTVGDFPCAPTGAVTVTGGSLFVTNVAGTAALDVRSGTLTISGGLLRADKIVITNACARFVRTGGTLQYTSVALNPSDDTDGDGFTNQQETNAGTDPLDPLSFAATVTSWTNGSGKWEVSTNWFPAVAPSSSLQAVFVTNAATKTVTIDATTSGSFAGTMTISNLTVAAPGGDVNTLQLTNAGTATPLRILNSLTNSAGGNILVSNSVLQVQGVSGGGFVNNGTLTIIGGGLVSNAAAAMTVGSSANTTGSVLLANARLVATNQTTVLGNFGVAQMTVSNSTWQAGNVLVTLNAGSRGTLTVAGGTNSLAGLSVAVNSSTATGAVWLTGGQLVITNNAPSVTSVGGAGAGQFTVSNGTWETSLTGVGGTMTIAGGNGTASSLGVGGGTGTVWMTGGQFVDRTLLMIGNFGHGRMIMSNGACQAADISVGRNIGDVGTLTVAGGTMTASSSVILGESGCSSTGIVIITGGSFLASNAALEVRSGTLTINGGTLSVNQFVLTNACAHFTRTGGTLIYGSATLNPGDDTDGDGFSNQTEQNAGSDPLDPNSVPSGQLGATPATLNFGTLATGTTAQASFVVTNTGAGVLNGTATVTGGPFSIVSGTPFSLAANKSTNVVVQFAPVTSGSFTNAVVFNAGAGGLSTNTVIGTGAIAPVANFTATPTNGVVPLVVTFTNTSTGTITNNVWNFGDTVTSNTTATVLAHTYNVAGSFTVTLIAQGPVGASTNSKPNFIRALNPPQLNVTPATRDFGTVTVGQTNTLPFSVINTGDVALTGTVATASPFAIAGASSFNVAPASTGTVQVSFIPTGAGVFSNHVVFSSNGGVSTNAVTGTGVAPGNISVNPASLDFGTIATGTTSQRVFVVSNTGGTTISNGTATVGAPFAIVAGQPFSVPAFGSINVTVQFAPINAGAFTAQVVFATANGGSSTNPVTGSAAEPPVAGFTANPTNGAAPLLVFFTDESTGTITNRLWEFGDGATSGGTAPTHTYTTAGVFSVSLTVSGPTGSDTLNRPDLITVTNVAPMAGFTASPTNGAAPLQVNFADQSTGTITNRLWTFGDGDTSTDINPSHTYTNAGSFTVSLSVFGPTGSNTLTRPNLIVVELAIPSADLELIKHAADNFVLVGSNLTYALTITNRGPDTATSVTVTDAMPAGVTFASASDDCTNVAGIVVCDLGTLTSAQTTSITIVVTATVEGLLTNIATVAATEPDPNPTNNTDTVVTTAFTVPPPPHDLAVVKLKAPKKIALTATRTSKLGKFKVTIQNLGPQTETIPDLAALTALVTVEVESLGTNCASFAATLVPPKKPFPISVAPNKKLNLSYQATFDCANDPAATTKTAAHNDYRTMATIDLGALGETDTGASNDICPRPPSGSDPGCGNKTSSGSLGGDVLTDVTVK